MTSVEQVGPSLLVSSPGALLPAPALPQGSLIRVCFRNQMLFLENETSERDGVGVMTGGLGKVGEKLCTSSLLVK